MFFFASKTSKFSDIGRYERIETLPFDFLNKSEILYFVTEMC